MSSNFRIPRNAIKVPPWSGPGVSVVEGDWHKVGRGRLGGLGQSGGDWVDIYLAQRREAEKRYGKVIINEGFASTAFPSIMQAEALALIQWWADRLGQTVGTAQPTGYFISQKTGSLSENEKIDLRRFAAEWEALKSAASWGNTEIKHTWDTALLAAQRLHASAAVAVAAERNTWLRAFKESVEDIVDPGARDPFGVGKLVRGMKIVLIAGAVVVGGLVVFKAISAARRALPPAS